jgi:hypothetical protein
MKIVNEVLKANKTGVKNLPEELQDEVNTLKETIMKYNMALEEVDEDDEEENANLDAMENEIAETDEAIASKIKSYLTQPQPQPQTQPQPQQPQPQTQSLEGGGEAKDKKKDNSVGWLVFAGVVFAATLGVVNIMKKRA